MNWAAKSSLCVQSEVTSSTIKMDEHKKEKKNDAGIVWHSKKDTSMKECSTFEYFDGTLDIEIEIPGWTNRSRASKEPSLWDHVSTVKSQQKTKWMPGMWISLNCAPSLSKFNFLHAYQIQPRSSWPLQKSRTLLPGYQSDELLFSPANYQCPCDGLEVCWGVSCWMLHCMQGETV